MDTIIEMQAPQLTTSSAATTTTSTATTTLPLNASDGNKTTTTSGTTTQLDSNILTQHFSDSIGGDGNGNGGGDGNGGGGGDGDGNGKCGKRVNSVATMNSNSNSKYAQHMPEQQQLEQLNVSNDNFKMLFNYADAQ